MYFLLFYYYFPHIFYFSFSHHYPTTYSSLLSSREGKREKESGGKALFSPSLISFFTHRFALFGAKNGDWEKIRRQ
jgi:hypothetical protein